MKVLLPAILSKVASRKDRSYSLSFETRELGGSEASILLDSIQQEGWILFSPNEDLTETDIPDEKADSMTGSKTQAQRLRSTLYVLWKQRGQNGSFESFYRSNMETIIELIKEKLEE